VYANGPGRILVVLVVSADSCKSLERAIESCEEEEEEFVNKSASESCPRRLRGMEAWTRREERKRQPIRKKRLITTIPVLLLILIIVKAYIIVDPKCISFVQFRSGNTMEKSTVLIVNAKSSSYRSRLETTSTTPEACLTSDPCRMNRISIC